MTPLALCIDGELGGTWPILDRGLAYGDGLFETIAVVAGRPRLLPLHRQRLEQSSRQLGLPSPPARLWEEVKELAAHPGCNLVKLIWTRGDGRGYRPDPVAPGRRLVMALASPPAQCNVGEGVRTRLARTRLGMQPRLAGHKHLNRLEQVLARQEWSDPAIFESLMLDATGALVEATQSNVFLVCGEQLRTPALNHCGVAGVMRQLVLDWLAPALDLPVRVERLGLEDLLTADEVLLTGSLIGICPVTQVDCWRCPPGPIAERLIQAWERLSREEIFFDEGAWRQWATALIGGQQP